MASAADPGLAPPLDKERHVKYWQRCYGSYLPSPYTASDSTRLTWACFIVSALDLLSAPPPPGNDRARIRAWVLGLQHPGGGFCGSPAHAYAGQGAARGDANLAATFFALILLATTAAEAGTAFRGVDRGRTLRWLARLQRADGSFGQNLWEDEAVGGRDMRHSYLAACVRWMLRGDVKEGDEAWEPDINVETMVGHIRRVQTYDGGLSESSKNESHAGYAYCAIGALALLDRPSDPSATPIGTALEQGIGNREALLKFLAGRQFAYQAQAEEEAENAEEDEQDAAENVNYIEAQLGSLGPSSGDDAGEPSSSSSSSSSLPPCKHVGYNGRWNKKADTCYYWWVAGTLAMLGRPSLAGGDPGSRRFVLEVTQHRIGGFAKNAGGPPDIYHSYLGLAALATAGAEREGLKAFDVGLCCTQETTAKIVRARDGLLEAGRGKNESIWRDDGFWG